MRRNSSVGRARGVVGIHAVREVLKVRPRSVTEVWLEDASFSQTHRQLEELARKVGIKVLQKSRGQLQTVASHHQGVACFTRETPQVDWESLAKRDRALVVVADGLEDPHNLGALLRSAWLLGAEAVLVPDARAVALTPTVCKVACGAAEHVPVEASSGLESTLARLKEQGFWVYGLEAEGKEQLWQVELAEKCVWVLGSEESGIRPVLKKACDVMVSIPQQNGDASFNASVAGALALGEWRRQRLSKPVSR